MLEYIVLGMVNYEDMTGYDIKKYIETGIGMFYKASFGSLYPILKKLTAKGCLQMYEKSNGGRVKNYYHITEEGREVFFDWLEQSIPLDDGRGTQLVKIYFFDQLEEGIRKQVLVNYRENNIQYLRELEKLEMNYCKSIDTDCYYYKMSVLYYGIRIVKEIIAWCNDIIERKELR